jgi:hypothetical protein
MSFNFFFNNGIAGYDRDKKNKDVNGAFGMFIGVGHYRDDIEMATIKVGSILPFIAGCSG